jgi:hypothetical protein
LCSWIAGVGGSVMAVCATICSAGGDQCEPGFTCKNDARNHLACVPDKLPEYKTCTSNSDCGDKKCIKSEREFTCVNEDDNGNPVPCSASERAEKLAEFLAESNGLCSMGLPNRAPCNLDADCAGGKCMFTLGGSVGYCSSACSSDSECGSCMACQDNQLDDGCTKICKPQGGKKLGEACIGDNEFECEAGGFCYNQVCTLARCTLAEKPGGATEESRACETPFDCPRYPDACNGGQCVDECTANEQCDNSSGYQCNPETKRCENVFACKAPSCPGDSKCGVVNASGATACFPKALFGSVADGDACKYELECKEPAKCVFVDAGATKKRLCARDCAEDASVCGAGTECVDIGGSSQCVPTQNLGKKADGQKCTAHAECAGRNCANIGEETICASLCSGGASCDAGLDCISYSSQDKAPMVALFLKDPADQEIGLELGANGSNRVAVRMIVKAATTGAHTIMVEDVLEYEPFFALFGIGRQRGAYTITIESDKTPGGAAVQKVSESAANNDVVATQTVSAPLQLAAALTPASDAKSDIDHFTINLTAGETVQILVTGPVLDVCYDQAKVAQSNIGGRCLYDFQCAAGLSCDLDTYKCSKQCTTNAECGGSQVCSPVQGVRRCVPAAEVGTINTGNTCSMTLDYQCKGTNPACISFTGSPPFCTVGCNPAQGAAACPAAMTCVDIDETAGTNNSCFKNSALDLDPEASCQGGFQCASGKCSQDALAGFFGGMVCECDPASPAACGADAECVDVLDSPTEAQNRCVGTQYLNLPAGEECAGNFQCASDSCVEDPASAGSIFASYICE